MSRNPAASTGASTSMPPDWSRIIPAASACSRVSLRLNVQGSLKEIQYAFDTLKADGIGLLTSYQDKYLGDPSFAPVYESSTPQSRGLCPSTTPACCRGLVPGIPPSSIEYATNSTRTIAHLVFSGTVTKYPDIRWIFSHSGGTLPFLTGRFIRLAEERKPAHLPDGPLPEFRKFHYELAQGNTSGQIAALLKMVPVSQVMYGTDYPFRDGAEVNQGIADWGFSPADLEAIERDNALRLLPRIERGNSQSEQRVFKYPLLRTVCQSPAYACFQFLASCSAPRRESARMV